MIDKTRTVFRFEYFRRYSIARAVRIVACYFQFAGDVSHAIVRLLGRMRCVESNVKKKKLRGW